MAMSHLTAIFIEHILCSTFNANHGTKGPPSTLVPKMSIGWRLSATSVKLRVQIAKNGNLVCTTL